MLKLRDKRRRLIDREADALANEHEHVAFETASLAKQRRGEHSTELWLAVGQEIARREKAKQRGYR